MELSEIFGGKFADVSDNMSSMRQLPIRKRMKKIREVEEFVLPIAEKY
jgi:hypothetical protein